MKFYEKKEGQKVTISRPLGAHMFFIIFCLFRGRRWAGDVTTVLLSENYPPSGEKTTHESPTVFSPLVGKFSRQEVVRRETERTAQAAHQGSSLLSHRLTLPFLRARDT